MKREIDILHGPIAGKVLRFALPLAATGILQQLFNAADVAVVGRFVGKNAMAAVGSNSSLIALLVNLFVGVSLGAGVVISTLTGQGDRERIHKAVHTSILVALISGVFVTIAGQFIAAPVLRLMGVPEDVFDMAVLYLRIYLLGMPVILLYNFESAIFRSQGDTSTPLFCLVISGVVNVVLNVFFVCVLHMTVEGVALATILSNLISASLLFFFLLRSNTAIRVDVRDLRIDGRLLRMMLQIGIPAGVQSMVFSLSNVIVQSAVNSLGSDVMAASSAAFNIEVFVYYIINAFGQASTTFVGQNYGAGQPDRCRKATRICLVLDLAFTGVLAVVTLSLGRPLLSIFNGDPGIVEYGFIRLRYILLAELLNVVIEVLSGSMRGYTYSLVPAAITLVGICGVRVGWVYTMFRSKPAYDVLMRAYPLSWAVTASALAVAYLVVMRLMKKKR